MSWIERKARGYQRNGANTVEPRLVGRRVVECFVCKNLSFLGGGVYVFPPKRAIGYDPHL